MQPGFRSFRRKRFFVKRALQVKYAVVVLALFAVAAFLVWWEIYHSLTWMSNNGLIHDPAVMFILNKIAKLLVLKVMIAMGLAFFLAIALSHYVAGPLYRMEMGIAALKEGDLTHRVRLRKHDQLPDIDGALNDAFERLQDVIRRDREILDAILPRLQRIADRAPGADGEDVRAIIQELAKITRSFRI